MNAAPFLLLSYMVVLLMVIDGGAEKVKDTENLIEDITDKLDVAIKDSVKNIKISPDAQEALDEFGIELGVVDGDQPTQQKGSSAKPPTDAFQDGLPFGHVGQLANQVEKIESSLKPTTFINRYVSRNKPVLIPGLLANSPGIKTWDINYLGNSPPSAMSQISVYDSSSEKLTQSSMSMRDFVKSDNKDLFMFDEIPSFLMKDLAMPQIFKCDLLMKSLQKHFLSYNRRVIVTEPVTMSHDRLICSMIGHTSFVLIPAASWELSATELHTIEYSAVNYTSHPWLKDIEYHVALNNQPGDCIYVPRNWYAQTSHTDPLSSTVEFTWKGEMKKVSKWSCGDQDLGSQHELGSFSKYFSAARPQRDTVKDALIHYFVFYLGDNLLSSFTSKQFIRKQKRDDKIFGKLIDWNSEVEEISTELFEMLDRNLDGRFSLADVQNISSEARDAFVSQIQDRLQDFGAIIDKQQKFNKEKLVKDSSEKMAPIESKAKAATSSAKPAAASAGKPATGSTDDLNLMLQNELKQEMDKLMKEMELEERSKNKAAKASKKPADKTAEVPSSKDGKHHKAKPTSKKAQTKPSPESTGTKAKEKYKMVEDEEIEIVAEDDDGGKKNSKVPNKSPTNNSGVKSSKQDSPKKPTSKQPKTSDSSTKSKKEPKKQKEEL